MDKEELINKAYIRALHFISHKQRTVEEVRKKMMIYLKKECVEDYTLQNEVLEAIINTLFEEKYLDDSRYIQEYLDVKTSSGKKSLRTLKGFLLRKGIKSVDIDKYTSELDENYDYNSAVKLGRKKLGTISDSNKYIIRRKLYTFLLGKGYTSETVERAVDTLLGVK